MASFVAPIVGAGIGLSTQDPVDHPFAAIAGAAIGGYAASLMSFREYIKPIAKISNEIDVLDQSKSDHADRIISKLSKFDGRLKGYERGMESGDPRLEKKSARKLTEFQEQLKVISANIDTVTKYQTGATLLNGKGIMSPEGNEALRNYVNANSTDSAAMKMLFNTMNFDSVITIADIRVAAESSEIPSFKIGANTSAIDAENLLRQHIVNQLGHGGQLADEAARTANIIAGALEGFEYTVDKNLTITTSKGKEVIPLTMYDEKSGTKFSMVGNSGKSAAVMSYNPFAWNFTDGKNTGKPGELMIGHSGVPTLSQAQKQFSPETMLAFLEKDGKDVEKSLSRITREIKSLHEFVQAEDGFISSEKRKLINNQLYIGYKTHNGSLRRVKSISVNKNYEPEMRAMLRNLAEKTGKNIFSGISQNSLGVINVGNENLVYPGLFPAMERGGDSVLERGYTSVGTKGTKARLEKLLDVTADEINTSKYAGVKNSIPLNRMDLSKETAKLVSFAFGNEVSLDDGAGLYKKKSAGKLTSRQLVTFKFNPMSGTNDKFQISDNLLRALNGEKILFSPNEYLGFDGQNNPARLGRQYTSASVKSHKNIDGVLHVTMNAKYNPDQWVKLFSQSSKAGLTGMDDYSIEKIAMLEMAHRKGSIRIHESGEYFSIGNNQYDPRKLNGFDLSALGNAIGLSDEEIKNAINIDFMLRDTDTGAGLLNAALSNDADRATKMAKEASKIQSSSQIVKTAISDAVNGSRTESIAAALFLGSITDGKANSDMLLTIIDNVDQSKNGGKESLNFLRDLMKNGVGNLIGSEDSMLSLYDAAKNAADNVKNKGYVTTLATVDVGEAIHGSGNAGRISWLEQSMLKLNGWTDKDISKIGHHSADALYELSMIDARTKLGNDYRSQKYKYGNKIIDAMHKRGDARLAAFTEMGMTDAGNGYIHYRLQTTGSGMKSIAIPLRETNLSGFLDLDGRESIKRMDRAKINLVQADIDLANEVNIGRKGPGYSAALEKFNLASEEYNNIVNSMFSGENNILKSAMRLDSYVSRIHTLRSADGNFAKFVAEQMTNTTNGKAELKPYVAMSKDALIDFIGSEDEIEYRSVNKEFPSLKKAFYKKNGQQIYTLISREPVQGPLSSYMAEIIVDTSIKKNINHAFIPNLDNFGLRGISNIYQFADFDADHVRLSLLRNMKPKDIERLFDTQKEILKTASDVVDLQSAMGAKGSTVAIKTLADFKNANEYYEYLSAAGQKGRLRKEVAAFATDISVNMNKTLEKHLGSLNLSPEEITKRSMVSRSVIHNIVESLIKTQHKETNVSTMGARTEIEQFIEHQRSYLSGSIGREKFEDHTRKMIMAMVGNKVNSSNIDNSIKVLFSTAVDDIVSSTGAYSRIIDFEGSEQSKGRFGSNATPQQVSQHLDALKAGKLIPSSSGDIPIDKIDNMLSHFTGGMEYSKNFLYENKKALIAGGIGLGITAAFFGSERPEPSKDILPAGNSSPAILQPLPDQKGYVSKGRDYRSSDKSYTIRASNTNGDPRQKSRELFNSSSNRVIIQDKRER